MQRSTHRRIGAIVCAAMIALPAAIGGSAPSSAQTYPSAPVRVLVPFGAGGATDILARVFSERLQNNLGQSFTVENRGGAAGQIAAAAFARAPADGYTLMFSTAAPITTAPLMNDKTSYDPRKDFIPVAIVAVQPMWLATNVNAPYKTFADVVQYGKANPGKLTYGSPGLGSEPHLVAEGAARSAGIQMTHVPFRSGGEVVNAMLGRQIDLGSLSTATLAPGLKQGTLRALAVSSAQRNPDFPDVPTYAELGHGGVTIVGWWGLMAVAGTPPAIVERLTRELEAITKDPAVRERLKATFVQVEYADPVRFNRVLDTETKAYGDIIRAANIKMQ
jgi:tripartite-type tricarboxylate transporter receptor subunit TctC